MPTKFEVLLWIILAALGFFFMYKDNTTASISCFVAIPVGYIFDRIIDKLGE